MKKLLCLLLVALCFSAVSSAEVDSYPYSFSTLSPETIEITLDGYTVRIPNIFPCVRFSPDTESIIFHQELNDDPNYDPEHALLLSDHLYLSVNPLNPELTFTTPEENKQALLEAASISPEDHNYVFAETDKCICLVKRLEHFLGISAINDDTCLYIRVQIASEDEREALCDFIVNNLEVSSPADLSSFYTDPVQEFSVGGITLNIPSSFERTDRELSPIEKKNSVIQSISFSKTTNDSEGLAFINVLVFENDTAKPFNTSEEKYEVINDILGPLSIESPSYKYVGDYLVVFTTEGRCRFAVGNDKNVLHVDILSSNPDAAISLLDRLMNTLKIDPPQQ